jgi:hypothetical protein
MSHLLDVNAGERFRNVYYDSDRIVVQVRGLGWEARGASQSPRNKEISHMGFLAYSALSEALCALLSGNHSMFLNIKYVHSTPKPVRGSPKRNDPILSPPEGVPRVRSRLPLAPIPSLPLSPCSPPPPPLHHHLILPLQVGLGGVKFMSADESRTTRSYPLDQVARWSLRGNYLVLYVKSPVDVEERAITLHGEERTMRSMVDTLTSCCMQ